MPIDPMTGYDQAESEANERFYEERDDREGFRRCHECYGGATEVRCRFDRLIDLCQKHAAEFDADED